MSFIFSEASRGADSFGCRLVLVKPDLLDVPQISLERQPTPGRLDLDRRIIDMVLLTRPPVIASRDAAGRYEVLANGVTVLWYRLGLLAFPSLKRRIRCVEVTLDDLDRERWHAIDEWCAIELLGWNSKRRSAEVRRGVRGTAMAGRPLRQTIRDELACLLEVGK